jgi:pimeloyl-ACP methyl ester carboxylesterase
MVIGRVRQGVEVGLDMQKGEETALRKVQTLAIPSAVHFDTAGRNLGARPMFRRFVRTVLLGTLMLGLGCCTLENRLLYHPIPSERRPVDPDSLVQDIDLAMVDGVRIHARWYPRDGATGALLYCHGNAGNLEYFDPAVRRLASALDLPILILDYPGFGQSEGKPSESGCYSAADAAFDWLVRTQGLAEKTIILYGESLGGGVAVELASHRPHRALILVRTFTSIPDMAQSLFGWLPVRWLVSSRFDSLAKIPRCRQPTFIAQADADHLVPFAQGRQLREASGANATFFVLRGKDHNDPLPTEFYSALRRFLDPHEHDRR